MSGQISTWLIAIVLIGTSSATTASCIKRLTGHVLNENKEDLLGATVTLKLDTTVISTVFTDKDGYFTLEYFSNFVENVSIHIYCPSYKTVIMPLKRLRNSYVYKFQMHLAPGCSMPEIIPVVQLDPTKRTIRSEDIEKMPIR